MTQTLRLTAVAAAAAIALLAGSSFGLAQDKERMGIDNVDKCDMSIRDPDCNKDWTKGYVRNFAPFGGERNQFYKDNDSKPHHRLLRHIRKQ